MTMRIRIGVVAATEIIAGYHVSRGQAGSHNSWTGDMPVFVRCLINFVCLIAVLCLTMSYIKVVYEILFLMPAMITL